MLKLSSASIEVTTVNPDLGGEITRCVSRKPNVLAAYDWRSPLRPAVRRATAMKATIGSPSTAVAGRSSFPTAVRPAPWPAYHCPSTARSAAPVGASTSSLMTRSRSPHRRACRSCWSVACVSRRSRRPARRDTVLPTPRGHTLSMGPPSSVPRNRACTHRFAQRHLLVADADYVTDLSDIAPRSRGE